MAQEEAFPSTYTAPPSTPTLLQNATVLTGDGRRLENTSVLLANGVIAWVGEGDVPPETTIVDASERWVPPGRLDVHAHLGVYPSPGVARSDGNEATACHRRYGLSTVFGHRMRVSRALASGVTAMQILPVSQSLADAGHDQMAFAQL